MRTVSSGGTRVAAVNSDGTSDAVAVQFPDVAAAIARDSDCYLSTNDVTSLDDGGPAVLLDTSRQLRDRGHGAHIVAGSTRHPDTGERTRGGVVHRIGNMDPAFVQPLGDADYGLRGRAAGCSVWAASWMIWTCAPHSEQGPDEQASWEGPRRLWSRQQLQPGPWAVYGRGGMRLIRQRKPTLARRGAV